MSRSASVPSGRLDPNSARLELSSLAPQCRKAVCVGCGCSAAMTRASPGPRLFRPTRGAGKMLGTCKAIGDIDGATGPAFSAALRDTIDSSDQTLVSVDCSGVTFMDPAGYHVLVDATRYAARRGHTLVIRNMSPSCTRLIRLYAWDRELRVEPSLKRTQMVLDALFFLRRFAHASAAETERAAVFVFASRRRTLRQRDRGAGDGRQTRFGTVRAGCCSAPRGARRSGPRGVSRVC